MKKKTKITTFFLMLLGLSEPFAAIPRIAVIPLLINDNFFLKSGWLSASLSGSQMTGYGTYDSQHLYIPSPTYIGNSMALTVNYGFTDTLDFLVSLSYAQNKSSLRQFDHIGDTSISLNRNIANPDDPNTNLSLNVSLLIPTGNFNFLDPDLYTTDATGGGSYQPSVGFTFSHNFQLNPDHALSLYSNFGLTYAYKVKIAGLSVFGGTSSTIGRIRPGNSLSFMVGMNYNLSDKWSVSMDYSLFASQKSSFKGQVSNELENYLKARLAQIQTTKTGGGFTRPRTLFNAVMPTLYNIGGTDFLGSGGSFAPTITPSLSYNLSNSYNLVFSMSVSTPGGRNTTAYYSPSLTLTKSIYS